MIKIALHESKLNSLVRKQVISILRELLDDPDFGLELTEYTKEKLRHSISSKRKGISLEKLKRKYL